MSLESRGFLKLAAYYSIGYQNGGSSLQIYSRGPGYWDNRRLRYMALRISHFAPIPKERLGPIWNFNSEGSNRHSKKTKITSRRQGSGSRGSNGSEAYMHRRASLITFNSIAALEPGDCLPFCNVKELGTASSPGVYKGASL